MTTLSRIGFLDGVRGLAAALVVVHHALESQSETYLRWSYAYANLGRIGVVAFFLVSGYVIPLSLEKQDLRTFGVRRFWRLYPVYWVALGSYLLVQVLAGDGLGASPAVLTVNVLMVQGLIGAPLVLGPSWTLGIELAFYAQEAAAKVRRLLDRSVSMAWVWLGVFVLFAGVTALTGRNTPLALPLLLFTASLGHALHLRDARGDRRWRAMTAAALVVVPLGSWAGISSGGDEWLPLGYGLSYVLGVGFFWVLYALRGRRTGPVLTWLGAISYAAYIMHPTVADVLLRAYGRQDWVLVALNLLVVPLVAWAVHRLVELPAIEVGRRRSRRAPSVPPAPVSG